MELIKEAWQTLRAGYEFYREEKSLNHLIETKGFVEAFREDIEGSEILTSNIQNTH